MIKRRNLDRGLLGGVALAALPAFPRGALAAFPDPVITLVVPFAPGGNTDLAGRLMADRIGLSVVGCFGTAEVLS